MIYVLTLKALLYIYFPPFHTSPPRPRMPNVKGSLARVVITYMTKNRLPHSVARMRFHFYFIFTSSSLPDSLLKK